MQLNSFFNELSTTFSRVLEMMTIGVAFRQYSNNKRYEFFSHEGDYIGSASTNTVETVVSIMKKKNIFVSTHGLNSSKFLGMTFGHGAIAFDWSFGTARMEILRVNPVELT